VDAAVAWRKNSAMPGPASGIRFIHSAILREASELTRLAEAGDLDTLRARLPLYTRILHLHIAGEEAAIFPEVQARLPDVIPPYLLEHDEERRLRQALVDAVERGDRAAVVAAIGALREHLAAHIHKENEILVPLIESHFSVEEQGAHMGKMMAQFTPADMAAALPWLVTALEPADRRAYIAMLERAAPPERVTAMLGMLRGALSAEVWDSLGRG
jgi:hemerythrin-like domain-containing protein